MKFIVSFLGDIGDMIFAPNRTILERLTGFLGILAIVAVAELIIWGIVAAIRGISILIRTAAKEETWAIGKVVGLEHGGGYFMPAGKTFIYIPESHQVFVLTRIKGQDLRLSFDSEKAYRSLKKGDSARCFVRMRLDRDGEIISASIAEMHWERPYI